MAGSITAFFLLGWGDNRCGLGSCWPCFRFLVITSIHLLVYIEIEVFYNKW